MKMRNPSKDLEELSDLLSITPIMSSPEVASIDDEISSMIQSDFPNIIQIINKLKERNLILKYKNY